MADIPGIIDKMNTDEVSFEKPLSEQFFTKISRNINGLIARKIIEFTADDTWTVPDDVTRIYVVAAGGGGGGGTGIDGVDHGGQGGCGAVPVLFALEVTAGEIFNITIGAGGAGGAQSGSGNDGSPGGDTIIAGSNNNKRMVFPGALGGIHGGKVVNSIDTPNAGLNIPTRLDDSRLNESFVVGNYLGNYTVGGHPPGNAGASYAFPTRQGGRSAYALGGSTAGGDDPGGGGGAGWGNGGNGATSASNSSPQVGGISAGGGGGFVNGYAGAAGGDGIVIIYW